MLVAGCLENEYCSKVLNFLERLDDRIRCTHEETVAVVERERIWEVTKVLAASSKARNKQFGRFL